MRGRHADGKTRDTRLPRRWPNSFVVLYAGLLTAACSIGPSRLAPTRLDYNRAIAQSWDEQLLLNLVRLRYRDTPLFLEINAVVSQFEYSASSQMSGAIPSRGAKSYGGLLGIHYTENPTVTYTPLQGETFAKRLLAPISPETVVLLSRSGWSIERLFNLCIHSMSDVENAPRAAGPTPTTPPDYNNFQRLSRLLRELQIAKALEVRLASDRGEGIRVLLITKKKAKTGELRKQLGLPSDSKEFVVTSRESDHREAEVPVKGRSLLGAMFFLSQGVQPPAAHAAEGLVTITRDTRGNVFDWGKVLGSVITIRSSRNRPALAAVEVVYRGHWFFIDDRDLNSKTTFNLLTYIFSLQASDRTGGGPLLTVPVGR